MYNTIKQLSSRLKTKKIGKIAGGGHGWVWLASEMCHWRVWLRRNVSLTTVVNCLLRVSCILQFVRSMNKVSGTTRALLATGMLVSGSLYTLSLKVGDSFCKTLSPDGALSFRCQTWLNRAIVMARKLNSIVKACFESRMWFRFCRSLCASLRHVSRRSSLLFLQLVSFCSHCDRVNSVHRAMSCIRKNKSEPIIEKDSQPEQSSINYFVFIIPAACDMVATCLMYIGLDKTLVSVYGRRKITILVLTDTRVVCRNASRIDDRVHSSHVNHIPQATIVSSSLDWNRICCGKLNSTLLLAFCERLTLVLCFASCTWRNSITTTPLWF